MIENLLKQKEKIMQIYLHKINNISIDKWIKANTIIQFEKGIEVGSLKYIETWGDQLIPYIRVANLNNNSSPVFIDKNIKHKKCNFDDILVSFDGAPGRIDFGYNGAYSSGLRAAVTSQEYKGLVYFALNSFINQKIIKDYSQGTTILHAGKAVEQLLTPIANSAEIKQFNLPFRLLINIKSKTLQLQKLKNKLLDKYFTNQ